MLDIDQRLEIDRNRGGEPHLTVRRVGHVTTHDPMGLAGKRLDPDHFSDPGLDSLGLVE
jgi:hypothetical protein